MKTSQKVEFLSSLLLLVLTPVDFSPDTYLKQGEALSQPPPPPPPFRSGLVKQTAEQHASVQEIHVGKIHLLRENE